MPYLALADVDATARYGILLLPAATTGPHCGRADGVHWRARQWACPRRSWSVEFETFGTSQPCFSRYAQTAGWVDGDTGARASAGLL